MPKISRQRKAEIAAEVKRKAADAVWDVAKRRHPDQLATNMLSMDQIARMAGVAKGTLYNYFKDKAELMVFVVSQSLEQYSQAESEIVNSDMSAAEKLLAITRLGFGLQDEKQRIHVMARNQPSMPAMQQVYAKILRQTEDAITTIVEQGRREGLFSEYDVEDIVQAFIGVLNCCFEVQLYYCAGRSAAERAATFIDVFLNGAVRVDQ